MVYSNLFKKYFSNFAKQLNVPKGFLDAIDNNTEAAVRALIYHFIKDEKCEKNYLKFIFLKRGNIIIPNEIYDDEERKIMEEKNENNI